ncbi:outer membrane lipoprotein carrier protein LolA [Bacteroidota bacterium]
MKKRLFSIMIIAAFAMGTIPAQDLQEILDTYFETIGQENLVDVKTMVSTGTMMQMGMELPFKSIFKRPDKAYLEAEIQGAMMKQGYDGKNGWMVAPWTGSAEPIDLTGPDLRGLQDMADIDGPLWNYQEKGHQLELLDTENMEGSEVFVLKLTKKDGDINHLYLDSENYVVLKVKSKTIVNDSEVEIESVMSNFQEVNGYIMAFTTEQSFGGQVGMTINIEDVKTNEEVEDNIFNKPVTPQE